MARISGVDRARSLLARAVFWISKRRLGNVPLPIRIHARHERVFAGYSKMELAQDRARLLPKVLKSLAGLRTAQLLGCPF